MAKTYIFHTDPGHGWLAVKRAEIVSMGLLEVISPYSYQKGNTVYLEEDNDMATFLDAYKGLHGVPPLYRYGAKCDDRHPIRGYEHFTE